MSNKKIQLKDKDGNNVYPEIVKQCILDVVYPVGSIYISVNNTNPGTLFGGTWEQINDRFLLACGSTYSNGSSGGSATHTHTTGNHILKTEEMPSHTHTEKLPSTWNFKFSKGSTNGYVSDCTTGAYAGTVYNSSHTTGSTGGGQPHNHGNTGSSNNMPPYLAVYVWKRTN